MQIIEGLHRSLDFSQQVLVRCEEIESTFTQESALHLASIVQAPSRTLAAAVTHTKTVLTKHASRRRSAGHAISQTRQARDMAVHLCNHRSVRTVLGLIR